MQFNFLYLAISDIEFDAFLHPPLPAWHPSKPSVLFLPFMIFRDYGDIAPFPIYHLTFADDHCNTVRTDMGEVNCRVEYLLIKGLQKVRNEDVI